MRNFSTNSKVHFQSYNVNCGEYVNSVDAKLVVMALAEAFETHTSLVLKAWDDAVLLREYSDHISPSEYEVLVDLEKFSEFERKAVDDDSLQVESRSFIYINLNTGRTVVWSFFTDLN